MLRKFKVRRGDGKVETKRKTAMLNVRPSEKWDEKPPRCCPTTGLFARLNARACVRVFDRASDMYRPEESSVKEFGEIERREEGEARR